MHKIKLSIAFLLIVFLSGCFSMTAKNYVQKTEPKFNEVYSLADSYGNILNNEAVSASQKIQNGSDLSTKAKNAKLELESLKAPQKAQNLNQNLLDYYAKIGELIIKINNLFEFIDITEKIAKSLEDSTKSLPTDFSKDLSATKVKFENAKNEQQKILDDLKEKDMDAMFTKSKQALIDMSTFYIEFLNSVITAIDVKKSDVIKEKEFEDKINKANDTFQKEMDSLQEKIISQQELETFNKLESDIQAEFNQLR